MFIPSSGGGWTPLSGRRQRSSSDSYSLFSNPLFRTIAIENMGVGNRYWKIGVLDDNFKNNCINETYFLKVKPLGT